MQFLWKEGWTPDLAEVLGVGKSLHNRRLSAVALVHDGWVRALSKILSHCFVRCLRHLDDIVGRVR